MATIKKIERIRNYGKRPTDNVVYSGRVWLVRKGQKYDLIGFSINELGKPYEWNECLCVPCSWNNSKVRQCVEQYCSQITDDMVNDYREFLNDISRWGCD